MPGTDGADEGEERTGGTRAVICGYCDGGGDGGGSELLF